MSSTLERVHYTTLGQDRQLVEEIERCIEYSTAYHPHKRDRLARWLRRRLLNVQWPARTITPCEQAPFGSYQNHIVLPVPPGLGIGGETGAVGLDYCIAHEVYGLWQQGVRTRASCCGHGKLRGFIAVDERDAERMEALGYEGERNEFGVMCWWTKTGCELTDTEGER